MTNLSFSSHWYEEVVAKEWFKVVCGNDITTLKVKPHFGVETDASDFIGRKYWPLIFFFQKISVIDDSNNKGHWP